MALCNDYQRCQCPQMFSPMFSFSNFTVSGLNWDLCSILSFVKSYRIGSSFSLQHINELFSLHQLVKKLFILQHMFCHLFQEQILCSLWPYFRTLSFVLLLSKSVIRTVPCSLMTLALQCVVKLGIVMHPVASFPSWLYGVIVSMSILEEFCWYFSRNWIESLSNVEEYKYFNTINYFNLEA